MEVSRYARFAKAFYRWAVNNHSFRPLLEYMLIVYGHRLIVLLLGKLSVFNVNSLSAHQAVSNLITNARLGIWTLWNFDVCTLI